MPNTFDTTSLTVINKIDAEIALGDGNPTEVIMGSHVVLNLLYIGGTRYPARGFRLRVYATATLRQSDAEKDEGRGLLTSRKAPTNIVFTPNVPIPGAGYDHDDDPLTPALLRPVTLAFDVPSATNFVEPSSDPQRPGPEPKAITYYMKVTILQDDEVARNPLTGYTSSGVPLPFGPALTILSVLIGHTGGVTVVFEAVDGWTGEYEARIGIADRPGAVGEWLDFLATPSPAETPGVRPLFGVFDQETLQPIYEQAALTPGERLEMYVEIQNRYPPDESEPTGSRINRGRTFFVYPFDVSQPSQPTNLRELSLQTAYSPFFPQVRIGWDFPADLGGPNGGIVPIDYYEYRYKLATETFFPDWTNNGTSREVTLALPEQYHGGSLNFEVRAVNNTAPSNAAENNLVLVRGSIASITIRVGGDVESASFPEPEPEPELPPQLSDAQRLEHIKDTANWSRAGTGSVVYTYVDGGSATVRNVPRGTRRVTFVGVPTLSSPLIKTGDTDFIATIFTSALASLSSADQV